MTQTPTTSNTGKIVVTGFLLVVILLIIVTGTSLYLVYDDNRKIQMALAELENISGHISTLRSISLKRGILLVSAINTGDPFDRDEKIQEYNSLAREFLKIRNELDVFPFTVQQKQLYDRAMQVVGELARIQRQAVELAQTDKLELAQQLANRQIIPQKDNIQKVYSDLEQSVRSHIQSLLQDSSQRTQTTIIYSLLSITIAVLIAIWISRYVFLYTRKSEQALSDLNRSLAEKNAAKSEFLSRMSHELRTPMNAIMGFSQLLELDRAKLHEEQVMAVDEIRNASEHLLNLINEVLDIQKVESGHYIAKPELIDLHGLIENILTMLTPLLDAKSITVEMQQCNKPLSLTSDRHSVKQILMNILSNAIKYNRPAGRIMISCGREAQGLVIRVTDTGPGIPADKLKDVFEPFNRLGHGDDIKGTGIGLTVARQLATMLGATIQVESPAGGGATFTIRFNQEQT